MRLVSAHCSTASVFGLAATLSLCALLTGCPEKGSPSDKTSAEPEPVEPDDQGKIDDEPKKPASAASSRAPADDRNQDEAKDGKEEGGR